MFYIKTEIDGKQRKVEIYGDELFTSCFNCGKEFPVDEELLMLVLQDGGSFSGTSLSCGCSVDKPQLSVIK